MAQVCPQVIDGRANGQYTIYEPIASGGMASVHIGRFRARFGFSRTVAIKRLHRHFAQQPEFVAMLLDEAHLASRINHPNVVGVLDVLAEQEEVLLVMEYVHGETLATLLRAAAKKRFPVPAPVISGIVCGALRGLHAAHTARAEDGSILGIVHRDMSPQNVMVGVDGVARVFDFGIAKAAVRAQTTNEGQMKGKFAYMAPEQLLCERVDARTDVFAVGVLLWECLTMRRLFSGNDIAETAGRLLHTPIQAPSDFAPSLPKQLDEVTLCALERDAGRRYQTAAEFADALEAACRLARSVEIGRWVELVADEPLCIRTKRLAEIEAERSGDEPSRPRVMMLPPTPAGGSTVTSCKRRRRKRLWVSGLILSALLSATVVFTEGDPQTFIVAPPTRARSTAFFAATPNPIPPVPLSAEAPPVPLSAEAPPVPLSAEAPSTGPTTPASSGAPNAHASRAVRRNHLTKRPLASCNPPYRIDAKGIRRVRRECL